LPTQVVPYANNSFLFFTMLASQHLQWKGCGARRRQGSTESIINTKFIAFSFSLGGPGDISSVEVKLEKTLTSHDGSFLYLGEPRSMEEGRRIRCGRIACIDGI
jgi:hypothetical protein